jgi:hypothetical protein
MKTSVRTASVALALGALALPSAAFAGIPTKCPAASLVSTTLGVKAGTPTVVHSKYYTMCSYAGGGAIPTRITFQMDTASTFAASEKAGNVLGQQVKVPGLGKAAWTLKVGSDLYVFTGSYTLKIVSPLVSSAKLEALARKLI